jgi:hypothetical protein
MGNTASRMYVSSVRGQRTVSTQQRARQLLLAPRYQLWRQHAVSAHWEVGYVFTYAATLSSPKARGEKEITDGATPTRPDIKGLTRPRPLFWLARCNRVRSCKLMLMLMMHICEPAPRCMHQRRQQQRLDRQRCMFTSATATPESDPLEQRMQWSVQLDNSRARTSERDRQGAWDINKSVVWLALPNTAHLYCIPYVFHYLRLHCGIQPRAVVLLPYN